MQIPVTHFKPLTTARLLLVPHTPESLQHLFTHTPKESIKFQLGLNSDAEYEKEKQKLVGGYTTYDRTMIHFKLWLKEQHLVIGGAGFHNWHAIHRRAELGYALQGDEFKQKGYMREALDAIIEFGFKQLDLNRMEAYIAPYNLASLALVKRYGFKQEGYLREHYAVNGVLEDSVVFGLLKADYEAYEGA